MLRDVLGTPGHESSGKCAGFTTQQLEVIRERALARQEAPASAQQIIERVIAPMMYRILFTRETPTPQDIQRLLVALATSSEHL
ncbi:TetR/AcrR family transcriptional regulator C-terminal ligand-binding domain-containing protein [Candidatus Symbiopectobacterium sp. 'North America']|uniref:TetR/AcrR family transcriptional regulator C-terminal ligand-binding domain-containing protein n=1 Tax=Candidatus Symbiopectobacterium sp. 'North America' TaxID=2794574 RepID=UPI001FD4C6C1|nr:TetR/AcrR family transcriptional regulator C-terminal ligand-binding domain-containing protein [Candidatus Symbiopectobacterium sp. 'North America']